jgi:hypothetical protein
MTAFNMTGAFALGSAGLAFVGPVAEAVGFTHLLGFAAAWGLASGLLVCCLPVVRRVRWQDEPAEPADPAGPGRQPATGAAHGT